MTPEHRDIPDWAQRERQADLGWMRTDYVRAENLDVFSTIASVVFENTGRGAIVVDTTSQAMHGAGHPFAYFNQETIEGQDDEDIRRVVAEYDPTQEFVVVILKPDNHTSTYRVGIVPPNRREAIAVIPSHPIEPTSETRLRPPSIETLMEWEAEGGCEAACPHHCWVEPDGRCTHGKPSWLLKLGLI